MEKDTVLVLALLNSRLTALEATLSKLLPNFDVVFVEKYAKELKEFSEKIGVK
jgi:hypothetical protein